MKIYIDILFFSSLLTSMLILTVFSRVTHIKIRKKRYLISSFLSGASSLIMLIDPNGILASIAVSLLKLFISAAVLMTAVGFEKLNKFISHWMIFITVNILFGGVCFLLWDQFGGDTIIIKNYTVYLNVPIYLMIVCIIIAYIIISIYDRIMLSKTAAGRSYDLIYSYGSDSFVMKAISDTGNVLTDSFSGEPVVIILSRRLYESFDLYDEKACLAKGFHLIPYSTIDGSRLMPVTLKGDVYIKDREEKPKQVRCAVGILSCDGSDKAIFNPSLLL